MQELINIAQVSYELEGRTFTQTAQIKIKLCCTCPCRFFCKCFKKKKCSNKCNCQCRWNNNYNNNVDNFNRGV